jgi:hypothetical protein
MGHANLRNIGEFFIHRLYAKGTLSVCECVQAMIARGGDAARLRRRV